MIYGIGLEHIKLRAICKKLKWGNSNISDPTHKWIFELKSKGKFED
jgi:hypothetical protein